MNPAAILRTALVVWLAAAASAVPLTTLTEDGAVWWQSALLAGLLVFVAAALRLARLSLVVVHAAQVAVLVAVLGFTEVQIRTAKGVSIGLTRVFDGAITQMRTEGAPLTVYAPTRWLLVAFVATLVVLTDLMVATLAAPAWALAPLATPYVIAAVTATADDLPWWQFVLVALGYLAMLAVEAVNRNEEWTRNVNTDTAHRGSPQLGVWRMALLIGVPALAITLLVGSALPMFGNTPAIGTRSGNGPIQMQDPTINLARDLNQPINRRVLTYTTSNGQPVYLRLATLSVVDASGWKLPSVSLLNGQLPPAPGAATGQVRVTTHVTIDNLDSEYLPAPYAPESFNARGQWAYDPSSLMVLSTNGSGRRQATRNLSYTVTAEVEEPNPAEFSQAEAGIPPRDSQILSYVPADVPQVIVNLARQITRGAATDAIKAADIQAYLTDPSRFTYNTNAPGGTGYDVLVNFLTKTHSGYCIHFASAMALMARIVGIPSRVSVGFAPGTKVGNHYEVNIRDAHAWPELYFGGYGWVRFEPTAAVASAPGWSSLTSLQPPKPASSASTSESAGPSTGPSHQASVSASPVAPITETPAGGPAGTNWAGILGGAGAGLLIVLLLVAPMTVRLSMRRYRLGRPRGDEHERIEAAWREIRDSFVDLGGRWLNGSPRAIGERLAARSDETAAATLRRVAHRVEVSRYGATLPEDTTDLAAAVRLIRRHWLDEAAWQERWTALVLPRSLWRGRGRGIRNPARGVDASAPPSGS